jgi:alpha-mannosidase
VVDLCGKPSESLWLPDVFGYPNCLPQILKLSGIQYFFTTKLTWSAITRFPHSSFHWRSPDGTSVLTHLSALGYNELTEPGVLRAAVDKNFQTGVFPEVLLPMGYGDGGGGTTEEMLERARRLRNLSGSPRVQWTTGREFFERLHASGPELPSYEGELYLEYHRGTYTTQSEFKRLYRTAEKALLEHEALRPLIKLPPLTREDWDRVLLSQFHDAIPGSSISEVYTELETQLTDVIRTNREAMHAEVTGAAPSVDASSGGAVFNPIMLERTMLVALATDDPLLAECKAAGAISQQATDSDGSASGLQLVQLTVPGYGVFPIGAAAAEGGAAPTTQVPDWEIGPAVLDNGLLRVEFDADGAPKTMSIHNRPLRFVGGRFVLYPDNPANFDAWDIDRAALSLGTQVAEKIPLQVSESGPLRASLEGSCRIGLRSTLTVTYSLAAGSRYLDLSCAIDWKEDHALLKYHAVTGYTGRFARFGGPYGSVLRSQVPGLPHEEAQWEVPGQRWAAIMDDAVMEGFAIITESKYGFSVQDGDIGVSLLRAPSHPDPTADRRHHLIRFSLGEYIPISIPSVLSTPAETESRYGHIHVFPDWGGLVQQTIRIDEAGSLVPCGIKASETGEFSFVLRFHETAGRSGTARISFLQPIRAAYYGDLLERKGAEVVKDSEGGVFISFESYKIVTVLVQI